MESSGGQEDVLSSSRSWFLQSSSRTTISRMTNLPTGCLTIDKIEANKTRRSTARKFFEGHQQEQLSHPTRVRRVDAKMDSLQQSIQDHVLTPLHPYLRPITVSLPEPVNNALISLLGDHCFTSLILAIDITKEPECLPLAISKVLGLAIVGFSAIVKVPQILKLLSSRSAAGVSFSSYALETASFLITLAYNARQQFPFSTYGESALIAVQDIVVASLVLVFSGQAAGAGAFLAAVGGVVYALMFSGETLVDRIMMGYLQGGAGVLGVASKVPQIVTIWKEGGTGQLSAFAVFNYLAGSLTRIFTTLQEVDDNLILYGFVAGFSLNLILALQMLYYWNSPTSGVSVEVPAKERVETRAEAKVPAAKSSGTGPSTRRRG